MIYILTYLLAIVIANLTVTMFNPAVIIPINAFFLIGLDLAMRDKLHDRWAGDNLFLRMLGLIATGGVLSWIINPAGGQIALASAAAFTCAAAADALVYNVARKRGYLMRSNLSNLAGAVVDSIVFPTVALFGLDPQIVLKMVLAKVLGGMLWAYVLRPRAPGLA